MNTFLVLTASILFGLGLYFSLCESFPVPSKQAAAVLKKIEQRTRVGYQPLSFDSFIEKLAKRMAPHIRLDTFRKDALQAALAFSDVGRSPEEHAARSLAIGICGLCLLPLLLPVVFLSPLLAAVGAALLVGLTVYLAVHEYTRVNVLMRRQKEKINAELPQFASSISELLAHRKHIPVLEILTEYRKIARKAFRAELDRTIADMKTSNMESALLRLDHRIGSTMMSEVVRGLIGILRGDDEVIYFQTIAENLREQEIAEAKKKASVLPEKVRKKSMVLVICILAMIFVMLGTVLMQSFSLFQGI